MADTAALPPDSSTTALDGIGPKASERLAAAGIATLADLVMFFPRRHDEVAELAAPTDAMLGQLVRLQGRVFQSKLAWLPGRRSIVNVQFESEEGEPFRVSFFNQPYLAKSYTVGMERVVEGLLDKTGSSYVVKNPRVVASDRAATGPILVRYREVPGVSESRLRGWIAQAIERVDLSQLLDVSLPAGLGEFAQPSQDMIRAMHAPKDADEHERARATFALVEAVGLFRELERTRRTRSHVRGPVVEIGAEHDARMRGVLPFEWTADQRHAVEVLRRSLQGPAPCGFLLHGDVGTGKTAVALDAALATIEAGHQVAFLAPTELLAEQHFASISAMLDGSGVQCELLIGSLRAAEQAAVREAVAAGEAPFVIGTHALISESTSFASLGLVVIDEQHRFGVEQRMQLVRKGQAPHVLVMTATPIPRTLTLTLFGDLDSLALRARPRGRPMPRAVFVERDEWPRVLSAIERHVRRGGQAYVVCPKIGEDGEKGGAVRVAEDLAKRFSCRLVHGRQPTDERREATAAFRDRECDVLVGTTVLEVGVDVPAATLMVVVSPERFGISTLHQLRGRVGRGAKRGVCVLVGTANARTAALCATDDGFRLAEEDLRLRGAGELLGQRQSGLADFRALDPIADLELLQRARDAVRDAP